MERLTKRTKDGSGNVYLQGSADVCWAGHPVHERAFCKKCLDLKNRDRSKCGPCLIIDRLAAYEDTGLEPSDIIDLMGAHGNAIGDLTAYRSIGTTDQFRALKEAEQKRREGCEWCIGFCPDVTGDPHWYYRICPMCGRDLRGERHDGI